MSGLVSWIPKLFTFLGNASVRHELVEATRMFERFAERMEKRCERLEQEIETLKADIEECQKDRARLHEEIAALKANQ